eukprot:symbB.v1.2.025109.t1/scaffold2418.1/size79643/2
MHLEDLHPHQALRSLLDELPCSCRHGCGWTGRRDALAAHEAPGSTQCIVMRLEAAQADGKLVEEFGRSGGGWAFEAEVAFLSEAGSHLRDRDRRIAELEARVAQQDQQVVDFGRQLLAREVRIQELERSLEEQERNLTQKDVELALLRARSGRPEEEERAGADFGLQPERLQGQHSYFPFDIFWPQNRWHMFSQILPFTPVELDQILLDVLTLAAVPPYPWGQLIYHDILLQKLNSGLQGNFAEFGVGLGGSSLFFGQMAARWGRKMLAVDSFQGLPSPDLSMDEAYFSAGDFSSFEGESNAARFQELLMAFKLNDTVRVINNSFAETVVDSDFNELAFVHIDGDLYHSVLDALEKVWDLVVLGGIIVIDDFFHKVQGPARAAADFFQSRSLAPLFHVIPAYAVLVVKGSQNCEGPRAMDGNFYSFELARNFEPFAGLLSFSPINQPFHCSHQPSGPSSGSFLITQPCWSNT